MRKHSGLLPLFAMVIVSLLPGCSKETALEKEYYGTVNIRVTTVVFPIGLKVNLINGADTMDVPLGNPYGIYAVADKPQKIQVYDPGTGNKLLGDTTITLAKDEKKELKFAWVEEAGIKQFYSDLMPADSGRVYFKNNLDAAYPAIDVYIFKSSDTTLATGVVAIQENLPYGVSKYPSFTNLLVNDAAGSTVRYIAKIKDRATGLFINDKGAALRDFFNVSANGGQFVFLNINGYKTNGRFSTDYISL